MNRHVIDENTALLHHLLDVPQAQRVRHIPAHAGEHHLKRVVQPFEDLAQGAVDQTLAEIEHGRDCRLCVSQQNPLVPRMPAVRVGVITTLYTEAHPVQVAIMNIPDADRPRAARLTLLAHLFPRVFVSWVVCGALYLVLTQFGQVTDLLRALNDNFVRHMFAAMGFTAVTGFCLCVCLRGLAQRPLGNMPLGWAVFVTLLAGSSAPVGLALTTFCGEQSPSIGVMLGILGGVFVPNFVIAQMWWGRGSVPAQRALQLLPWVFALFTAVFYSLLFFSGPVASLGAGPIATLFICSSVLLWAVWFISARSPVLLVVLMVVIGVLASMGSYGVRNVRTLAQIDGPPLPRSAQYAAKWLQARRSEILRTSHYPVFFVTSDGGGVRSSYWTTQLLGALADDNAHFVQHTYALSGVSGGSLGVAVFAAQTADTLAVTKRGGYRATAKAVLSRDFLAAPFSQMLTRDPFESVFCLGIRWSSACSTPAFDRAVALEQEFERAWTGAMGTTRFDEPIGNLWKDAEQPTRVPALILNSTNARTGELRMVSSLSELSTLDSEQDVLARMPRGRTLRLSTATLLSARFPVISPAGELALGGQKESLVDGGYFDNSGGAGALPVFLDFMQAVRAAKLEGRVVPVAIIITNDPERSPKTFEAANCTVPKSMASSQKSSLGSLLSQPLGTLDAGRSRSAEAHRGAWTAAISAAKGESIALELFRCQEDHDFEFPLGWSLSVTAQSLIDKKVARLKADPASPYGRVLELLPN